MKEKFSNNVFVQKLESVRILCTFFNCFLYVCFHNFNKHMSELNKNLQFMT